MKGMILAAGEGTRLRPLTLSCPKAMLPIAGKPLLEQTICYLRTYGVTDLAINLHYRPEVITDYIGDGHRWGVTIRYSHEPELLGAAGALKVLGDCFDTRFVVVYGDILTDLPLDALLTRHAHYVRSDPQTVMTLALHHVPNPTACGIVALDEAGRIIRFVEKPAPEAVFGDLANAGILVMEPEVLAWIPADQFWDIGFHLLPDLLAADRSVYGWVLPAESYLLDIGTPEQYARAQREWPKRVNPHVRDGCLRP